MPLTFSPKELILIALIAFITTLTLPFILVPLLEGVSANKAEQTAQYNLPTDNASPQAMVDTCKERINLATQTEPDALRIDSRSTGFREARFNVHGYVRQDSNEYDFQCWFHADFSFDTFTIGRVSLEEIQRASALRNF